MAVVLAVAFGSVGMIAQAAIPDSNGVIHGCIEPSGVVRIIDSSTQTCNSSEKAISWNQTGPAGPAGQPGAAGAPGAAGPPGPAGGDQGIQEFTGNGTWTAPSGVSHVLVTMVGAGGPPGAPASTTFCDPFGNCTPETANGGGGGGGAWIETTLTVTPGAAYAVQVGPSDSTITDPSGNVLADAGAGARGGDATILGGIAAFPGNGGAGGTGSSVAPAIIRNGGTGGAGGPGGPAGDSDGVLAPNAGNGGVWGDVVFQW